MKITRIAPALLMAVLALQSACSAGAGPASPLIGSWTEVMIDVSRGYAHTGEVVFAADGSTVESGGSSFTYVAKSHPPYIHLHLEGSERYLEVEIVQDGVARVRSSNGGPASVWYRDPNVAYQNLRQGEMQIARRHSGW